LNPVLNRLTRIDTAFFVWLTGLRHGGYPWISRHISRTGDGPLYAAIGVLLVLVDPVRGYTVLVTGLVAFSLELPAYLVLKRKIRRNRPRVAIQGVRAWLEPSDEFSFPSGHTAAAFVMAWVLSSAYPFLAPLVFTWAAMIGFSRVSLGVHFPGDIAAGALLGLSCAALASFVNV
jgi:undecaprenyl-diphosphatase